LSALSYISAALRADATSVETGPERGTGGGAGDWELRARAAFVDAYRETAAGCGILSTGVDAQNRLLAFFELEKAIYELRYELDNRPDWTPIPVAGIRRLLESE